MEICSTYWTPTTMGSKSLKSLNNICILLRFYNRIFQIVSILNSLLIFSRNPRDIVTPFFLPHCAGRSSLKWADYWVSDNTMSRRLLSKKSPPTLRTFWRGEQCVYCYFSKSFLPSYCFLLNFQYIFFIIFIISIISWCDWLLNFALK